MNYKSFVLLMIFAVFICISAMGSASAANSPSANFTSNTTNGSTPLSVQFNDTSKGSPTSWLWNFGDGKTSTKQNPVHNYTKNGNYSVSLTVTNVAGSDSLTKSNYITVLPTVNTSLTGGTYKTAQKVELTCSDTTATIYYANDTTDPRTSSTRTKYSGTITISKTTTLRYAALDTNGNWSPLYIQNYVIGNSGAADSAWPEFGGNSSNTGQSKYTGPKNNFTVWTYMTENPIYYAQPVIGSDGTIYVGAYNGKFYALNPDGTQKWSYAIESYIWGSAAIGADGTIYIGSYDKKVYALNPDGTQKWNYTTKNRVYGSPAISADGTIYIGSSDGKFYALNPDGTLQWIYATGNSISQVKPAIGADGTIYIGSYDSKLYAINPDGTLKWTYTAVNSVSGSPAIGADGSIYFGDYNGTLYALNPDGTRKWNYTTGGYIYGSPAISTDGTIYIGSSDGNLYAFNPDGTRKWNCTTGGIIQGSPTIGSDGTIYFGSGTTYTGSSTDYGKVYALNPDGTLKWTYTIEKSIMGSPTIGSDGTLYIGSYDSNIYAFKDLPPVANFTTDVTTGGVPITVHFTDQSLYAKSWKWNFGDGTSSTLQNPTHTYTKKGNYTVSLTVYNYLGNSTTKMPIALSILPPVANFTADNASGISPFTVHFTDQSSYATSWAWNFGDGTSSTLQNPTHTYKTLGYYTVSLTATGPGGSKKTTKTKYILIIPTVNASITGGTYKTTQTVKLSSNDPKATIYYAADTTDPRNSSTRTKYTGPISINQTTTLRYAALDTYGNWSPLYTQNYVIESGGLADTVWAKPSGDLNNTGRSNYTGPEVNTTLWNYTIEGSLSSLSSPVIGADGTIYIGSDDGNLYALNPDGTLKWNYTTGASIQGSPIICADGTIYIGSSNGKFYAINPDGTLKWTYKTRGGIYGTAAAGADGIIYVGSDDGLLYAFNSDGILKWTYDTETYVRSRGGGPAIGSDGTIYFENSESYSKGGNLYALNPDGTLKWYYTIGGSLDNSPTIGTDGTIYVGGFYGPFYAINPDGTLKWTYMTYSSENERYQSVIYNSAIGADGTIYFGCYNGIFYALKPNGTLKWTYSAGVVGSTTIGADGTIYIGNNNGNLYALNPDGTLKWTYNTGTSISCLTIGANETLYFGSGNTIYSIANTVLKANQTAGAAPLSVQFKSSGISPVSWKWDFGDGTTSTEQNPVHKYANAGYYTVTLTVTSSNGQKRIMKFTNYIKVYNSPVSSFTASTGWGTVPSAIPAVYNQIQFKDISANTPTSWYWDFGDGTNSTLQNPTHAYTNTGTYTVKLTVTNPAGNNTFSYPIQVLGTIFANSTLANGTYNTTQTVTLMSDDSTATIYYTNDTTDPTTSSTRVKYTGPITISKTTTLRYAAVTIIGNWSPVYVQNYIIGTGGLADTPNPTYQGDNNHTGQSEYTGPQTNNTKWNNSEITPVQDTCVSIGPDGTIYAGSSNGYLYALYPTGIIKWRYYTESSSQVTTPVIGKDRTIYIAASGYLHAVKADGTSKWKYQINNFLYSVSPSVGQTEPYI